MREKLQEAARTGLDMSPGDPVAAWAEKRISQLEALCADAYAMIEHEPASDIAKQNFLQRIRSTLGWKIQL